MRILFFPKNTFGDQPTALDVKLPLDYLSPVLDTSDVNFWDEASEKADHVCTINTTKLTVVSPLLCQLNLAADLCCQVGVLLCSPFFNDCITLGENLGCWRQALGMQLTITSFWVYFGNTLMNTKTDSPALLQPSIDRHTLLFSPFYCSTHTYLKRLEITHSFSYPLPSMPKNSTQTRLPPQWHSGWWKLCTGIALISFYIPLLLYKH